MNVRHLVPSVSRRLLSMGSLMLAAGLQQPGHASGVDLSKCKRIEPQYIAALGDPGATSGNGAQSWGLWSQDPGPRGCKLDRYDQLKAAGGVAPSQWKFDAADWWLEEHGLIMEKPTFPLPPGKYLVTGDRKVTTVLTIQPKDKDGNPRRERLPQAGLRGSHRRGTARHSLSGRKQGATARHVTTPTPERYFSTEWPERL